MQNQQEHMKRLTTSKAKSARTYKKIEQLLKQNQQEPIKRLNNF